MKNKVRTLIDELETVSKGLSRQDCLLTWEQSDADLKAILLATEILEELYRGDVDARLFRGGLAVSIFRDKSTRTRFSFASAASILGLSLMAAGFFAHLHSDRILIALRGSGEAGYRIPERGLHRWVCNPNYLGEIVEWAGWALATWSVAGLAFALFTTANLAPRALANLRWYRDTFEDYPSWRKALIPGIF